MAELFKASCRDFEWSARPTSSPRGGSTMHEMIYPHHRVVVKKLKSKGGAR